MRSHIRPRFEFARALANRDFALLWSGQTISLVGNGMFSVALPLQVLRLTGSAWDVGLVASANIIPSVVLMLAGGTLADRVPPRLIMLVSDSVCAVAVGIVTVLVATGRAQLWELVALNAVFGLASAFLKPSSTAITADILPPGLLASASSLTSLSLSMSQYLVGPLAGGLIMVVIDPSWAFGLNAFSFVASAVFLALMRPVRRLVSQRPRMLRDIREGLSYCRSQPWLWWGIVAVGIANLACYVPLIILEPVLVRQEFGADGIALGIMYACSGVGGIVASVVGGRRPPRRRVAVIFASWAGAGVAALLIGLAPWLWAACIFAGLAWFGATYGNVLWFPLMQQEVPRDLLGRASAVDWMVSLSLTPVGVLVAAATAEAVGVRLTLIVGGLIALAAGALVFLPGVTDPDHRQPRTDPGSPADQGTDRADSRQTERISSVD